MKAPQLVTRALVTSFLTVALVLGAVFALLSLQVREQVRQSVADNLASAQQVFKIRRPRPDRLRTRAPWPFRTRAPGAPALILPRHQRFS